MANASVNNENTPSVIELKGLTKRYGTFTAVDGLSLAIRKGEVFGLLGPNGAGKTTTILMMLGLTERTSGSALICGYDPARYALQVKRRVGYMPDDIGFYEDRTGLDNLIYTARLNGIEAEEAALSARRLLEKVGLAGSARAKVGTYSRGMRQRLGLADVLIKNPEVIILDEPTLGIDPEGVRELLVLISDLSRNEGITVLLSSHQLQQVQQICDRVGLFVQGRLIACGDIATLSRELNQELWFEVELAVQPWSGELAGRLEAVEGVLRLETEEWKGENAPPGSMLVTLICDRNLTSAIAAQVIHSGAELYFITRKEFGLDEIYHRYFERREEG
ncbi:ABC transporter ATP-binding protein [Paenibacillus sp. P3E]|uniref:ABC transporter ATP-binding protein n=1 Tax=Paenibacillus sp. P3E TaxID=1349435 RepID=UPI00093E6611|nr:ABC transporter ATP-binding protein [Paenibacillus sp. P3E]OKP92632.1 ABC transporter ATP-binding protein [Paenibacillus sp. P3E]